MKLNSYFMFTINHMIIIEQEKGNMLLPTLLEKY